MAHGGCFGREFAVFHVLTYSVHMEKVDVYCMVAGTLTSADSPIYSHCFGSTASTMDAKKAESADIDSPRNNVADTQFCHMHIVPQKQQYAMDELGSGQVR